MLVARQSEEVAIPYLRDLGEIGLRDARRQYLGQLDGRPVFAAQLPDDAEMPAGMVYLGLRQLYGLVDEEWFGLAGRAFQIMDWDRTHQFCGRCASPTESSPLERAKVCPQCGLTVYPRVAPAVIVLVERGDKVLLAHSGRQPSGMYSVLAGFVEPGETLEQAVAREIKEEVGIEVQEARYFGSQPWPFPHSLMVAFTAAYAGGEIVMDGVEIEDAGWYAADNLPIIPGRASIARKLIDWFVAKQGIG